MSNLFHNTKNDKLADKARSLFEENVIIGNNDYQNFEEVQRRLVSETALQLGGTRNHARRRMTANKVKFQENLKHKLFMEALTDIVNESLLLDESFKRKFNNSIYKLCETSWNEFVKEGRTSYDKIMSEGSEQIKHILMLCEEKAERTANAAFDLNQIKDKNAVILNEKDKEKEIDADDKEDLDEKTKEDKTDIANVVKDKVTKTVKKEKEEAEKEDEINKEIKEKSKTKKEKEEDEQEKENEPESDETSTENTDTDDNRNTDKSNSDTDNENDTKEDTKKVEEDDEKKSENISLLQFVRKPSKATQYSLFKSIQINVANEYLNEQNNLISEGKKADYTINMDLLFAESLAYYTLLEAFYTAGIINFTPSEARGLARNLIVKNK